MSTYTAPSIASILSVPLAGTMFWIGWWAMTLVLTLFVIVSVYQLLRPRGDVRP